MILMLAVLVSFLLGLIRTRGDISGLARLRLRSTGLVFAALILQMPLLRSPGGSVGSPFPPISILFLLSYPLLLVFVWRNRHLAGSWMLGVGVLLNLVVIAANGGFMPISPDTLARLKPSAPPDRWETNTHRHHSKGIILSKSETLLWALSDILALPPPFPLPTAFSLGDAFLAAGAFVLLQEAMGNERPRREQEQ
jgi:hypothetical protein